ncbi:inactive protein RESTRICTED TEV MOVEMENT 2-like [Gastrolobium bilobum]|uniref:inactive protein RESTRICTED TEV MOVEMENT 2-like n=1 Tax=Gastrolobium bilobum TaxID=150636 RepID=UPI002AB2C0B3|nr:inactive protein RESTRICTED TEV MOVEMENT 2-like [Gastrolobium bilobum]
MNQTPQSAANRVYQDFDPFFEWAEDEGSATLIVMLPGFIRDQLRVQVTSTPVLRINGERQVSENIWRRFAKEFSIPPYCDANEVSAKFERGMLSIKFPKLIMPQEATNPPELEEVDQQEQQSPQKEKEPTSVEPEAPPQKTDQQESPQKEKEPISYEKEKNKVENVAPDQVAQKKVRTNGVSETAEITTSKTQEKQKAKITQRLKTRVLDFTLSLRTADDQDGNTKTGLKRPKTTLNIIVAILLVMVLGVYVKNAFRSSQGGSKFQEF